MASSLGVTLMTLIFLFCLSETIGLNCVCDPPSINSACHAGHGKGRYEMYCGSYTFCVKQVLAHGKIERRCGGYYDRPTSDAWCDPQYKQGQQGKGQYNPDSYCTCTKDYCNHQPTPRANSVLSFVIPFFAFLIPQFTWPMGAK